MFDWLSFVRVVTMYKTREFKTTPGDKGEKEKRWHEDQSDSFHPF